MCGGKSFRATTWTSATKRPRQGFECLSCGARVRKDQLFTASPQTPARSTLPAPADRGDTWRPPSARKPPGVSGTYQVMPERRRPLKKHG